MRVVYNVPRLLAVAIPIRISVVVMYQLASLTQLELGSCLA